MKIELIDNKQSKPISQIPHGTAFEFEGRLYLKVSGSPLAAVPLNSGILSNFSNPQSQVYPVDVEIKYRYRGEL